MIKTALTLLAFAFAAITGANEHSAESAEGLLPTRFFENLNAGREQTAVVYGTSLSDWGEWTKALGRFFEREFPDQVNYHNSAKAGKDSRWGVENIEVRVLAHQPDLVFIEFSANDAAADRGISVDTAIDNLDTMVSTLRKRNPRVEIVLMTMNPAWDTEKNYAGKRPRLSDHYEGYRRYARQNELILLDVHRVWTDLEKQDVERFQRLIPDGLHPSREGDRTITWPAVRELLEKARAAIGQEADAEG